MKKSILFGLLFCAVLLLQTVQAQVLFTSDFETWSGGAPTDWMGSATNIGATNVVENSSSMSGQKSCQLINATADHKRFSSQNISIQQGASYKVEFYVKGQGSIRTGIFNGATGYSYSAYIDVNSTEWLQKEQIVSSDATAANGQLIFSLKNTVEASGHLLVDMVTLSLMADIDTIPIHDIQFSEASPADSPYKDAILFTYGVVTATYAGGYFIQDGSGPWSGLYIYDNAHTPVIGDSVLVKGNITEYFEMTEMTNVSVLQVLGTATVSQPSVITTAQVTSEQYESVLVKVLNAKCTNPNAGFGMWAVNDNSGECKIHSLIYEYIPTLDTRYNITGPSYYAFDEFRIEPRSANDVEQITGISENQISRISVSPNPAIDFTQVSVPGLDYVIISDYTGKSVLKITSLQDTLKLDVSQLKKSTYYIQAVNKEGQVFYSKFIKL